MPSSQHERTITRHRGVSPRSVARVAVAALIVAGLAVGAPALAQSVRASAAAGGKRTYKGKTAQGLAVKLAKPTRGGRRFTYQATMACSDGTTFTDLPFVDLVKIRKHGRFSSRFKSDGGATQTDVRGRIAGRRASGTVKINERYSSTPNSAGNFPLDAHGSVTCRSGAVKWTARAR